MISFMVSNKITVGVAVISIIIGLIGGFTFSNSTNVVVEDTATNVVDTIKEDARVNKLELEKAELESKLHTTQVANEQYHRIQELFGPIYERIGELPPQEQSVVIRQLEDIVMNSIIVTSSSGGESPFIVPKDNAKYGPTSNFEKAQDSVFYPLMNENYSVYSVFEDFEETVYLPGLTLTNGDVVENNGVDADDGKINGNSNGGRNYLVSVSNSIVFDFDESGIPSIPNYFGVVLTDYQCAQINDWYTTPIIYRVYGDGPSPIIEDSFSFGSKSGNISEDSFLGFYNKDGISSVEIEVNQPTCSRAKLLQIDHIQYGLLK